MIRRLTVCNIPTWTQMSQIPLAHPCLSSALSSLKSCSWQELLTLKCSSSREHVFEILFIPTPQWAEESANLTTMMMVMIMKLPFCSRYLSPWCLSCVFDPQCSFIREWNNICSKSSGNTRFSIKFWDNETSNITWENSGEVHDYENEERKKCVDSTVDTSWL